MRGKERQIVWSRLLSPKGPTILREFFQVGFVTDKVGLGTLLALHSKMYIALDSKIFIKKSVASIFNFFLFDVEMSSAQTVRKSRS